MKAALSHAMVSLLLRTRTTEEYGSLDQLKQRPSEDVLELIWIESV
jgi:hypothetical protein